MKRRFNRTLTSHDFTGSGTKHRFILQNASLHGSIIFIAVHPQLSVDRLLSIHSSCLGISLPYQECWHIKGEINPQFPSTNQDNSSLQIISLFQGGSVTSLARIALNKWLLSSDSELRHRATNSSLFKRSKGDSPLLPLRG